MASKSLTFDLFGRDKTASRAMNGVGKTAQGLGKKIAAVGATLVAAFAVSAITSWGAAGVRAANDLDKKLREVVTLTGEVGSAATAALGEFQSGVKELSAEIGVAQEALTGGLYQAISAGVPGENVFSFMEIAAKAAIAGVTDTETAVDGLTTVINAFGLETSQAQGVADSLFAAVQGGKTTFQELSKSLFHVGPAAASAGVDFKEINAAIATLTSSGTPTSVATTQIRAALVGLQRPSAEMNRIFQRLGFENAQLAIESRGLTFALDAVKKASGGNNGELQLLLGSVEAVAAVNVLAGTGAAKFADEMDRQAASAGAAQAAFDEIDKARSLERLQISMENLQLSIGEALLPAVVLLIDEFSGPLLEAAEGFADWLKGDGIEAIKGFIEWVKESKDEIQLWGEMIVAATVAMWILNAALTANPVGATIAGIALMIGAFVWLADVVNRANAMMDDGKVTLKELSDWWSSLPRVVQEAAIVIQNAVSGLINFWIDGFNRALQSTADFINGMRSLLGIGGTISFDMIGRMPTISNDPSLIPAPRSPNVVAGGASVAPQNWFASGGIVRATPGGVSGVVAEAGHDEAIIPLTPANIAKYFGGGGGVTVELHGNGVRLEEFVDVRIRHNDGTIERALTGGKVKF